MNVATQQGELLPMTWVMMLTLQIMKYQLISMPTPGTHTIIVLVLLLAMKTMIIITWLNGMTTQTAIQEAALIKIFN